MGPRGYERGKGLVCRVPIYPASGVLSTLNARRDIATSHDPTYLVPGLSPHGTSGIREKVPNVIQTRLRVGLGVTMQPSLGAVRARARTGGVAIVITIGLLASIATSGYATEDSRISGPLIPLTDLDEPFEMTARACADIGFAGISEPPAVTFELRARVERPPTGLALPVHLEARGTSASVDGVLNESTVALALRTSSAITGTAEMDCSDWVDVTIGPATGVATSGRVSWDLTATAEVYTSGVEFPWEDNPQFAIEVRR